MAKRSDPLRSRLRRALSVLQRESARRLRRCRPKLLSLMKMILNFGQLVNSRVGDG